jgi:two-component sensor histidine kinase
VQDLSTSTMTGTPQFYHLLGVEPPIGPVPQDYARSFRHPDDRERVTSGFRAALESGADVFESEYRIIRPSGEVRWIFGRGKVTRDKEGRPWRYSGVDLDITERRNQDEHLRVVVRELQHRTNNLLTIVQSLAQQTARGSSDLASFVPTFTSRLRGLSQSGALLARQQWRGAMLDELVISHVEPLAPVERFDISGPAALLTPRAAQNLGLALHELATNATKHGALSVPAGRVSVHWAVASDGALELKWQETGGPPVSAPKRKGFGRVLMEEIVASAIGAKVDAQFLMDGFAWSIAIPSAEFTLTAARANPDAPAHVDAD